ncbi:hypothetical protein KGA66_27080 [Actinocrinis puniceicyclus]|uniref:Uncharacterized protein n=1 Tax=Actinocrinis puniceicyclus TaxID=977794 RepID=A0A8J8BFK3_9ACTN|nr:hypothetical protein [Actinocrinis puniceicyclus]MBS2966730.1 hypothetical protein [Actinocrinis puniceicyclus]
MVHLRVIAPAPEIRDLIDRLRSLPGLQVVESSRPLPARTPGAVRQYLTLIPTPTVERS